MNQRRLRTTSVSSGSMFRPRGRDEEVGDGSILGGQEPRSVLAVAVEEPLGESQGRPLVAFAEALRPSHPVREHGGSMDDVVEIGDGVELTLDPVQVVGLLEPLVRLAGYTVERDGEVERRADQWSRR